MKSAWSPLLIVVCLVTQAVAHEQDRAAPLYSTQIRFDEQNVPVISVGIMDRQKEIVIHSPGPLRVLPEGLGGAEVVVPGGPWSLTLKAAVPGKVVWRVELERHPADSLEKIQAARQKWKKRGHETRTRDLGSVFGFFGKVMDTRRIAVVLAQDHPTREKAQAVARSLAKTHGGEPGVFRAVVERPRGTVQLSNGETTIRGPDVLWFEPVREDRPVTVRRVEFGRGFSWHSREDRSFRGLLYATVDSEARLAIANAVPAETMLRGVVAAEIYPSAPPAALQAQAVAARAEVLAKIGLRHHADPFLICSDVHCQVYAGTGKEDDRTDRAIVTTRGRMLFHDGHLLDTVYSASCGGHSEHRELAWSGMTPHPSLRGHADGGPGVTDRSEAGIRDFVSSPKDAWCGRTRLGARTFRWKKRVSVDQIRRGLKEHAKDVGVPRSIRVLKRGESGRAVSIEVRGTHGRKTIVDGELVIRKALGGLRSSLFVVDTMPGANGHPVNFVFTGAGFGHGVGMCQHGAIGMGEAGKKVDEILDHYYPHSTLERIY